MKKSSTKARSDAGFDCCVCCVTICAITFVSFLFIILLPFIIVGCILRSICFVLTCGMCGFNNLSKSNDLTKLKDFMFDMVDDFLDKQDRPCDTDPEAQNQSVPMTVLSAQPTSGVDAASKNEAAVSEVTNPIQGSTNGNDEAKVDEINGTENRDNDRKKAEEDAKKRDEKITQEQNIQSGQIRDNWKAHGKEGIWDWECKG